MEYPSQDDVKRMVEALLFASPEPVTVARLTEAIAVPSVMPSQVRAAVEQLMVEYDKERRAFEVREVAGGYQVLTRSEYAQHVSRLKSIGARSRLSHAAIETLAIIAYKQPITRSEIESIRGVQSAPIVRNLMDMRLVRMAGRAEALGRPALYGTTKEFLEKFGMRTLEDLPKIEATGVAL